METHRSIQNKIEDTFKALDAIEKVTISPFFKDKTMQHLFTKKEEQNEWYWFAPKWQLATLVCVVVLNIFVFTQLRTDNYNENVSDFAKAYGLSVDAGNSILN